MACIFILFFYFLFLADCKGGNEIRAKRNATVNVVPTSSNCKTECQTESDGHTQKCVTKCQVQMPFQMISQQQIQLPATQIISKMTETRQFTRLEDCVKFCQGKGNGKTAEECQQKCQPSTAGTETLPLQQPAVIPQLTLSVPIMTKITQTHEFVGQLDECVKYCQEQGIGKSAEECRGKCHPIGATVDTKIVQHG